MGFHCVPPNGFPDIPDIEDLEAVIKYVSNLAESVSGLEETKADSETIAPTFSAESNYAVGDLVYYEGVLYKCTTAHEAAAWDAEDFTETDIETAINSASAVKANKADIAPTFSADSNYAVGDLVYYEGVLYECTTAHEAAAWDAEDFTAATISGEINAINSNITTQPMSFTPETGVTVGYASWAIKINKLVFMALHLVFDSDFSANVWTQVGTVADIPVKNVTLPFTLSSNGNYGGILAINNQGTVSIYAKEASDVIDSSMIIYQVQ